MSLISRFTLLEERFLPVSYRPREATCCTQMLKKAIHRGISEKLTHCQ